MLSNVVGFCYAVDMEIVVSGSHGFIGSAVVASLRASGHRVTRLARSKPTSGADAVLWDPVAGTVDLTQLQAVDAVVHLAGASIVSGRWTPRRKSLIRDSRVRGTRTLCEALAKLATPPRALLCASAIGYYGDRGDEVLTEDSPAGAGFLATVCREWEGASVSTAQRGVRVVHLRFGMVLSPAGGALAKMLPPFRLGLGGPLGDGRQYMSWVSLEDVLGAIHHALETEALRGAVNVVSPQPVTNRAFTRALGRVLSRPTVLPAPAPLLRLLLGELADEALLASARVMPTRLQATAYAFRHPELEGALRHLLSSSALGGREW